ncbi:hypothetical protein AB0I99_28625 [Streptomyces spongiicola]|uniref:hypothetical protein n=1 Tax=Streptomyces spongiicola TaxID=1690221 RepID=UPI0033E97C24
MAPGSRGASYGLIGLVMTYPGLASLGIVRGPLRRVAARFPNAPMVFMGCLIGAFLVGRPFPLFRQLFRDAAESRNVLYGAAVFGLQTLGNIVVTAVLLLVVTGLFGDRLHRWMSAKPSRASALMAAAFIAAGVFGALGRLRATANGPGRRPERHARRSRRREVPTALDVRRSRPRLR